MTEWYETQGDVWQDFLRSRKSRCLWWDAASAGSVVETARGSGPSVCGGSGEAIPKLSAQNAQGNGGGGRRRD